LYHNNINKCTKEYLRNEWTPQHEVSYSPSVWWDPKFYDEVKRDCCLSVVYLDSFGQRARNLTDFGKSDRVDSFLSSKYLCRSLAMATKILRMDKLKS
jgi:hypothetical protein